MSQSRTPSTASRTPRLRSDTSRPASRSHFPMWGPTWPTCPTLADKGKQVGQTPILPGDSEIQAQSRPSRTTRPCTGECGLLPVADFPEGTPWRMGSGQAQRSAAAQICRRAAALYERRAREVLGRSRRVRRSVLGLALLVVPFVAAQRWLLVRDASPNPASAQVSGPVIALCHKPTHNAAEIGAKSARRGFGAADHRGGGHFA